MKQNRADSPKKPFWMRGGFLTLISSVLCILIGLFVGFLVLLCINAEGAPKAILTLVKNFFYYKNSVKVLYYFGSTLVKTVPLILCSLSVLFAYRAGLFNIGAAGQYVVGAGAALWCALGWHQPWIVCTAAAICAGMIWGMMSGALKAYCNVNEVISCIMLNWIGLYLVNMLLTRVKETGSPYTLSLERFAPSALLPTLGLPKLFSGNKYIGLSVPLTVLIAVLVWVVLEKTKLGYELKATGLNKFAAKYAGMREKRNGILTMAISGALAGLAAAMLYLTGIEEWSTTASSIPSMGFDGIAAAFLGGLHPIGVIFSSYFIKHIMLGGAYIDKSLYSAQTADLISAIIIYLCAFVLFFRQFMTARRRRKKQPVQHTEIRSPEPEKVQDAIGKAEPEGGSDAAGKEE